MGWPAGGRGVQVRGVHICEKSQPHLCCFAVPLADEGLWDMFVKDIPRSATSYTVSLDKLRQGVTYEFRVVAVNKAGYGEPSSPSTAVSGGDPFQGAKRERRRNWNALFIDDRKRAGPELLAAPRNHVARVYRHIYKKLM